MKKVMFAMAAVVAGVTAASAVESQVVGYIQNDLPETTVSGTIDVGVNLSNIGVTDGKYTVSNKLFSTDITDSDVLLIFNPNAYNYDWYQYFLDDGSGNSVWGIQDMETFEWTYVKSFDVKPGDSVVYLGVAPDVNVAGQSGDLKGASRTFVIDLDSEDYRDQYFPISNPLPVDTTAAMFDGFIEDGDVILVWNDAAYNYDWYQYFADSGSGEPAWGIQDMETFEWSYKTKTTDIILPIGHGGIFIPISGGTRTWTVAIEE